jgi:hypothetical protein
VISGACSASERWEGEGEGKEYEVERWEPERRRHVHGCIRVLAQKQKADVASLGFVQEVSTLRSAFGIARVNLRSRFRSLRRRKIASVVCRLWDARS